MQDKLSSELGIDRNKLIPFGSGVLTKEHLPNYVSHDMDFVVTPDEFNKVLNQTKYSITERDPSMNRVQIDVDGKSIDINSPTKNSNLAYEYAM
jgi:hypothetical protein